MRTGNKFCSIHYCTGFLLGSRHCQLHRSQLQLQDTAVSINYVEVIYSTLYQTIEMHNQKRCLNSSGLSTRLLFQDAEIGQIVLDFLERHKRLLTIERNALLVDGSRVGQIALSTPPSKGVTIPTD